MQTSFADMEDSFPRLTVCLPDVPTEKRTLFVRRMIYGAGYCRGMKDLIDPA